MVGAGIDALAKYFIDSVGKFDNEEYRSLLSKSKLKLVPLKHSLHGQMEFVRVTTLLLMFLSKRLKTVTRVECELSMGCRNAKKKKQYDKS